MIRRIAIFTSGGDAPGMNAAVRVCIRAGLYYGKEMFVIYDGYRGLLNGDIHQVNKEFTADIITRGGTILRSSRVPEFVNLDVQQKAIEKLKDYDIDAIIGIGGDGTFRGLKALSDLGFPVIGIPATIDNDVASTDYTIGFMTALNTICECIDKIKDTSSSHQRCSVIEVMGRHCGDLAIYSSIAEAAEMTLSFGHKNTEEAVIKRLKKLKAQKKSHAIVVVSENLLDVQELAKRIEEQTGFETRAEILGRLQRGGSPCAFDRILASRLGLAAIETLIKNEHGKIMNYVDGEVVASDILEALQARKDAHDILGRMIDILQ
jgi:6-phosphofructokinase 1